MQKLDLKTPDLVSENIRKIAELFPNCVTEAKDEGRRLKDENASLSSFNPQPLSLKIDFDLLRQELSADLVEGPQERYRLDWPGKREALALANAPIAKTLRPCHEESVDFETTRNLYIEGDNLDALKLLQETYLGKVKMIYIDPPYNTGNDFIYDDNFSISKEEYQEKAGERDEQGNAMFDEEKWKQNSSSSGRFHSEWLSMMYPRLKLARNLLADDGVIFASIDDSESANLKRVFDEVFGEQNFIDTIAVEMSTTSGPKTVNAQQGTIVKNVEFVHIYQKSDGFDKAPHSPLLDGIDSFDGHYSVWLNDDGTLGALGEKMLEDEKVGLDIRRYGFVSRDKFSVNLMDRLLAVSETAKEFIDANLKKIARVDRPPISAMGQKPPVGRWESFDVDHRTYYLTTLPNGTLQALMPLSLNYRNSDDYKPRFGRTVIRGDLWKGFHQDMGNVAKEGELAFANGKKPVRLIKQLMKWAHKKNDTIILDFFSGSATTAHAVMQLNAEDGGKRRHIMVQLPEPCDAKSEAAKAGYATIAEIGKERIRRAGKKILAEWQAKQAKEKSQQGDLPLAENLQLNTENSGASAPDVGFRVLKIDSGSRAAVFQHPADLQQDELGMQIDNLKPDRSEADLLFQVMLDWGVDLTLKISREIFKVRKDEGGRMKDEEYAVFFVDDNALAACFAHGVDDALIRELAKRAPLRAVFRDSGFATDAAKINAGQLFKALSPHTEVKTL